MAKLFLLSLTITALILHEGEAIWCWVCNSNGEGQRGCADPFGGSTDNSDDLNMFSKDCDKLPSLLNLIPGAREFIPTEKVINDSGLVIVCSKLTAISLGAPAVLRGCAAGLPNVTTTSCMYVEPQKQTGGHILTCDACSGDFCNGAAGFGSTEPQHQTEGHIRTCDDCPHFCDGAAGGGAAAMLLVVSLLLLLA